MTITPHLWEDVDANTYEDIKDEYDGLTYEDFDESPGLTYFDLLEPVATDGPFTFVDGEVLSFTDSETITFSEDEFFILDDFFVVFNDNVNAPGFVVTVQGLLEGENEFDVVDVLRRDPSGRYHDQRVRGLANINVAQNNYSITDYEAPLNVPLEYYVRVTQTSGSEFLLGPAIPTPLPHIPVQAGAYGGGTTYLKPVDIPELSRPVLVDKDGLSSWTRPARVLAKHHVLGRANPVVVTDVRGGREGTMRGHCIRTHGQSWEVIEDILAPGVTILIQNHNPTISTYPDMYVQVEDVTFTRVTTMVPFGELDTPEGQEVVATFEFSYTQVDRPDPTGEIILEATWQVVNDTFSSWERVFLNRNSWIHLLQQPVGPDGDS